MHEAECSRHAECGVAGSYAFAFIGTADSVFLYSGSGEVGAIHEGTIVASHTDLISGVGETVVGTAHVGPAILLRDDVRGG
jgi:hypothetical protein